MATDLYLTADWPGLQKSNHPTRLRAANQKLVSFMCGLGLVGGPAAVAAGLSGLAGISEEAGASAGGATGDAAAPRRGETGAA